MKPEQSVLNKLAKFSAKEVELSAEPMKVEFASEADIMALRQTITRAYAYFERSGSRGVGFITEASNNIEKLKGQLSGASVNEAESIIAEIKSNIAEANKMVQYVDEVDAEVKKHINDIKSDMVALEGLAKALGANPNQMPLYKQAREIIDAGMQLRMNFGRAQDKVKKVLSQV